MRSPCSAVTRPSRIQRAISPRRRVEKRSAMRPSRRHSSSHPPRAATFFGVKIATWNVNSIRTRLPRLLAWLERRRPDIVCLQETKVEDERFPVAELGGLGYRTLACGEKTYNGVAILSRSQGTDIVRCLPDDGADAQRRILVTTIDGVRI